uniref:Uncharacterized protein n=1 Tax=Oryza brachyantha TaxID=4533 RepID=J3M5Q6_ORYBR
MAVASSLMILFVGNWYLCVVEYIIRLTNNCHLVYKRRSDRVDHMTWNGTGWLSNTFLMALSCGLRTSVNPVSVGLTNNCHLVCKRRNDRVDHMTWNGTGWLSNAFLMALSCGLRTSVNPVSVG